MFAKVLFLGKRIISRILLVYSALFLIALISEAVECITSPSSECCIIYCEGERSAFGFDGFYTPEWTRINPAEDWGCPAEWTKINWEELWATSW